MWVTKKRREKEKERTLQHIIFLLLCLCTEDHILLMKTSLPSHSNCKYSPQWKCVNIWLLSVRNYAATGSGEKEREKKKREDIAPSEYKWVDLGWDTKSFLRYHRCNAYLKEKEIQTILQDDCFCFLAQWRETLCLLYHCVISHGGIGGPIDAQSLSQKRKCTIKVFHWAPKRYWDCVSVLSISLS